MAFLTMSDGSLTMHEGCVNASYHMAMKMENIDLAYYTEPYLKAIDVGYKIVEGEKYFRLTTRVHPFFTTLYERIYPMGHKTPSPHDWKLLDWEAMAILYMCDGSIQKCGKRMYPMLNLCRFSYAELQWLRVQMKEILQLDISVYKCGKYWRMGVPKSHAEFFFENVRPYMLPSFSYKLPDGWPLRGGEIVRSSVKAEALGGNGLAL